MGEKAWEEQRLQQDEGRVASCSQEQREGCGDRQACVQVQYHLQEKCPLGRSALQCMCVGISTETQQQLEQKSRLQTPAGPGRPPLSLPWPLCSPQLMGKLWSRIGKAGALLKQAAPRAIPETKFNVLAIARD